MRFSSFKPKQANKDVKKLFVKCVGTGSHKGREIPAAKRGMSSMSFMRAAGRGDAYLLNFFQIQLFTFSLLSKRYKIEAVLPHMT